MTCLVWSGNEEIVYCFICVFRWPKSPHCVLNPKDTHIPRATTLFEAICPLWHTYEDIPIIRENMLMDGSISAVVPKLTSLIAIRGNKLPVHSAGLSSSAFHLHWVSHCWHLQVWCLCYQGINDLVRFEFCGLCWFV